MSFADKNRWPSRGEGDGRWPGREHGHRHHHPDDPAEPEGGRRGGRGGRRGGPEFAGPAFDGPGLDGPPFMGPGRGRGFGPGRGRGEGRGRGRGRAQRGDVRMATLLLLAEEPMHGYQLMQAMADRTGGNWRPSPGAIYPTISQLEDEGLVTTNVEGGRKLVTLTEAGMAHVEEQRPAWGDPFAELAGTVEDGPDLRGPLQEVHVAARQISHHGSRAQAEAAATVLADARRRLYLILAEAEGETGA